MGPSIAAWTKLCPAIERLSNLRRLRIWLDHAESCPWSVVNERAVLSPLGPLSSNPSLDILIHLPKLHPKWEKPDRHFTEDSPPPSLVIRRRYRQRYHGIRSNDGSIEVVAKTDFPVLHELVYLDEGFTMEEVEEMEATSWKKGEDPFRECFPDLILCGLTNI